jgi:hypothetical protein
VDQPTPKELRDKIEQIRRLVSHTLDITTQARLVELLNELKDELDRQIKE